MQSTFVPSFKFMWHETILDENETVEDESRSGRPSTPQTHEHVSEARGLIKTLSFNHNNDWLWTKFKSPDCLWNLAAWFENAQIWKNMVPRNLIQKQKHRDHNQRDVCFDVFERIENN